MILFSNSVVYCQLSGYNRVTYGNYILKENVPPVLSVEVIGKIGHFPNWEGLNNIINDVNKAVEVKLRSKQPYKVVPYQNILKTSYVVKDTNYAKIENIGNSLIVGINLQECHESERDWYFDFYASIYPGTFDKISKDEIFNNLEERFRYIDRDSKIKRVGNDIKIIENLNSPSKEDYKILTNLISGPKYKNEVEYQASISKSKPSDEPISNSKIDNLVKESKPINKKEEKFKFSDDPKILLSQLNLIEAEIKKSKMSASKKQEALANFNILRKQAKDLIELKKLGNRWDGMMNFKEERNRNGKIINSRLLEYLNESEKKILLQILNGEIDVDPQSKNYTRCGTKEANCKFCGIRMTVNTNYRSIGMIISSFNYLPFVSLNEPEVKEIKSYLRQIRSGKHYICFADESDLFCSRQHKYLFDKR